MVHKKMLFLLRHGEAQKNIQNKHGIVDTNLTGKGIWEVIDLVGFFLQMDFGIKPLVYSSRESTQVLETVSIIKERLKCQCVFDDKLSPISLGVISGLTEAEISDKYPQISIALENWINGDGLISELRIPQAEHVESFWNRGKDFINSIILLENPIVVVGDRSILILIINYLLNNGKFSNKKYKHFKIPTGGLVSFCLKNKIATICSDYQTFDLEL